MFQGSKPASRATRPDSRGADRRVPELVQLTAPGSEPDAGVLRRGIAQARASIPPRYFYDDLGSRLFAAITALDEYYPTRTEAELVTSHLAEIGTSCRIDGGALIDLGAGNCEKAMRLLPVLRPAQYVAVDISAEFLQQSLVAVQRRFPHLDLFGVGTDFSRRLELPPSVLPERRLFFYPGSSIGNFTPDEAVVFLRQLHELCDEAGGVLIGVDLEKDPAVLQAAYDDALGVTASFNRNVLRHVNRLASTDFDVADWAHVAEWVASEHRMEMYLRAERAVEVRWPGGLRRFPAGERIHTEYSYKYTVERFSRLLERARLRTERVWTDERAWFAMFLARPEVGSTSRQARTKE